MKIFSFFIFIISFSSCYISIGTDSSERLTPEVKEYYLSEKKEKTEETGGITFHELDAEMVRNFDNNNKPTWIYIWATWCKPCIEKLPTTLEYFKNNQEVNLLLVSTDYDFKRIETVLGKMNYNKEVYILNANLYSNKSFKKLINFRNDLCDECDKESVGVPTNFLMNNKNNVVHFELNSFTTKEIDSIIQLKINY